MSVLFKVRTLIKLTLICLAPIAANGQSNDFRAETETLLNRLNLEDIGPKKFNDGSSNLDIKANNLLNYYKKRSFVKHPITEESANSAISEKDRKWANDALQHIFVGQPAYPSHFCGDAIDWNSRPVPDNEWVWQLNRMYFWNAMGKVYAKTSDERYAEEWVAQLVDWTTKNPRDEAHKYSWRSIEAGIRGRSWTGLFHQFIQSEHFTAEALVAFMNSCYEHAEFLMTTYSSGSNWALMEAEGMAFIAFTFPEFKNSEKWKTEAIRRLNKEMDQQVNPDGHQRELAMGYHIGSIGWFYRTYELAKLNHMESAFPTSYINGLERMCEVPMKLGLPDGTNAQFGDAWAGQPGQYSQKFKEWSDRFNRMDFLFLATDGKQGTAPEKTAYALKESGLYSFRSGWHKNAVSMVLKCGPDGGGHSQPDNGTFTLYAGGRTLMPDSGSYIYSGDPEGRKWFRQTKAHQTLTLDGENTQYKPKLVLWQPGKDLDILVVENAGYDQLTHRRSVFFVDKRYFVIVDEAIGKATGEIDLHFQLAPGNAIFDHKRFSVSSDFKEGWNVLVRTQKQKGLELSEEEGWVSFEYTKKEPRPAFRYRIRKTDKQQPVRFTTLVMPYEKEVPKIKVTLADNAKADASQFLVVVKEKGKKRILEYSL